MAKGINLMIILGNLGKDPEVRYTANGTAIATLTVATTDSWKDRSTDERREQTEWHRVVFFGRLAEIAGEYLRKGRQVYIQGKKKTRSYEGEDGQKRYITEIIGSELQLLGGKGGDTPDRGPTYQSQDSGPQQPAPQQGGGFDDFDDDVPM